MDFRNVEKVLALVAGVVLSLSSFGFPIAGAVETRKDLFSECPEWAERGDCKPGGRPYFMQQNCPDACHKLTYRPPQTRKISDDDEEFYELSVKEASTGRKRSMEDFEGYVTVIVNAARVCDYSDVYYDSLEHMHSVHPYALEILAFPFDHPSISIEECRDAIEASEKKKGRKIHVMEPIEINGPKTHPVFKYLKKLFNLEEMDPNFAHVFFVTPDGNKFELHYGATYNALKQFVDHHVSGDYTEFGDPGNFADL